MKQINKSRCWFSMIFPNIIICAVLADCGQKIDNKKFVIWWIWNYDTAIPQSRQRWSPRHPKRNNQVSQIMDFFIYGWNCCYFFLVDLPTWGVSLGQKLHPGGTFFGPCPFLRGLSQITFALRVGRWSEKLVVYYIKSAN